MGNLLELKKTGTHRSAHGIGHRRQMEKTGQQELLQFSVGRSGLVFGRSAKSAWEVAPPRPKTPQLPDPIVRGGEQDGMTGNYHERAMDE